ncbi:putative sporulation protein YtxC [Alkalicoccobacillus porphyridii]|uniref:Putative sporulation protein YtxC n=1 Tax=Alkalicoccobacillus porphyridii TaxID=2597270 RepID=A0A554A2W3_9BACI|nr:putative sporulation protein YtxC [Alkalicoccobacillus porphyridii]TSB48018.1 putative sporulation protein YtxC [Alkalicoccobacillus porphyridii]
MIAIHFEEKLDCSKLYQELANYVQKYQPLGLGVDLELENEAVLYVKYEDVQVSFYDSFHPLLASVLTEFVVNSKEEEWLLTIIEQMFYFTDQDEQHQILSIAKAVLEGERSDLPDIQMFFNRKEFIYQAFAANIEEDTSFYYEPFLTFRLREYGELLIDCVEMAIDEYMLEQDYQNMLENCRQHLRKTTPKVNCLYIVHEDTFTIYDQQFRELTKEEILYYLEEELVFEEGADLQDIMISPLVSMAPKTIHLFTDSPENGIVLSVQAIFEERLHIYPLKEHSQKNHKPT